MYKALVFALTLYVFQDTTAYCCFRESFAPCSSRCEPEVVSCDVITYKSCAAPVCVSAPCYETCNPCSSVYVPAAPYYDSCSSCSVPCCRNARPSSCGCVSACPSYRPCLTPPVCGYGAGSCYRDTVCCCNSNPTSVCSCLRSLEGGCESGCRSCGRSDCGCERPCIYFPEVEYPVVACEMEPFYYNTCFCA